MHAAQVIWKAKVQIKSVTTFIDNNLVLGLTWYNWYNSKQYGGFHVWFELIWLKLRLILLDTNTLLNLHQFSQTEWATFKTEKYNVWLVAI